MARLLETFRNLAGNVTVTVALLFPILAGVSLAAVSVSMWTSQRSSAQNNLDAAALAGARLFADAAVDPKKIDAEVRSFLRANVSKNHPGVADAAKVEIDAPMRTVTVSYSGLAQDTFSSPIWDGVLTVKTTATARWGSAPKQVCILIVEPLDNHTLRSSGTAKTDLRDCMVQVNTANWDAVESAGSSYIHVINGESCFVGDIHFGDVKPAKTENCTFFPDPFKEMVVAVPPCGYHNYNSSSGGSLSPGVYCGGIQITSDVVFRPGVYYVKDGPLKVAGNYTDITANGVTFILTGRNAGIDIRSGGIWRQTPSTKAIGGKFAGFLFFLDPQTLRDADSSSVFQGIDMELSGIMYLAGQAVVISKGSNVKMDPGSIVADYLLPQSGNLDLRGSLETKTGAEIAMRKFTVAGPVLVH